MDYFNEIAEGKSVTVIQVIVMDCISYLRRPIGYSLCFLQNVNKTKMQYKTIFSSFN